MCYLCKCLYRQIRKSLSDKQSRFVAKEWVPITNRKLINANRYLDYIELAKFGIGRARAPNKPAGHQLKESEMLPVIRANIGQSIHSIPWSMSIIMLNDQLPIVGERLFTPYTWFALAYFPYPVCMCAISIAQLVLIQLPFAWVYGHQIGHTHTHTYTGRDSGLSVISVTECRHSSWLIKHKHEWRKLTIGSTHF